MKMFVGFLLVMAFVLTSSAALARGAPNEKAFTDQAIVSVDAVAPTVELRNVAPLTNGYDVIQNLTPAYSRLAIAIYTSDTSAQRGQSTTVAERNSNGAAASYSARSSPNLEMGLRA